jgi:phage baseplate assembly protein W
MATYTSDRTTTNTSKSSIISAKKKEYRDLDLSLTLHPTKKDIMPLRDDQAIKNAIKNLIVTNAFERPFKPALGASLGNALFEPPGFFTENTIEDRVRRVIVDHEPRVKVLGVAAAYAETDDSYRVNVKFLIKENDVETNVDIRLRRLR